MSGSDKDIWRDTPVRLLGYANEIGESFRFIYPGLVGPSYMLATGYCFCDVIDKAHKSYKRNDPTKQILTNSFDAAVWQILASVTFPGFVINRTVHASTYVLTNLTKSSPAAIKWVPVMIGICTIPFIVEPIDHGTSLLMD